MHLWEQASTAEMGLPQKYVPSCGLHMWSQGLFTAQKYKNSLELILKNLNDFNGNAYGRFKDYQTECLTQ